MIIVFTILTVAIFTMTFRIMQDHDEAWKKDCLDLGEFYKSIYRRNTK
jgi:hypothetical protein